MGPGGLDGHGAIAAVGDGALTADTLVAAARAMIAQWEPWLGAVVTTLDPPLSSGHGPLHGMVVGVKDLMSVAGAPMLCGAPDLVDNRPQADHATVVARLVDAGTSLVATLQTHQLAYGIITPQTRNPRAPGRIAGGSSGGPGAALAAGLVHGAVGTDTGGSVRIPAACCGVVGLKTTRGLVPLRGVAPLAWSLDTVGPMAVTVADVALLLDTIAGHDPADPYSAVAPPPAAPTPVERLRVGVPRQVAGTALDDDVRHAWETTLDRLADDGARIETVDLPSLDEAPRANGRILGAEALAVHEQLFERHGQHLWPSVSDRLAHARTVPATKVARARHLGVLLDHELRCAPVDVLVTPTLPCRVPDVGAQEVIVGGSSERVVVALTRLVNPWNLAGGPAGSVPAGVDGAGAPIGVQVVGRAFCEAQVLEVMAAIEQRAGGPWPSAEAPAASR